MQVFIGYNSNNEAKGRLLKGKPRDLGLFALFLSLSFPLFYFVYKFGDPEPLAHDFFQYYHLYQRMDIDHVISPHNMRLCSSFLVFLLYKLNLFIDTDCTFNKYADWGFMKQVYFSAVFMNYIFVSLTCFIIYKIIRRDLKDRLMAFVGGLMYLLGFGTIFYSMMPLTEAFSILLFTFFLYHYRVHSWLALLVLPLLVFQREYLLVIIFTISAMDFVWSKKAYHLKMMFYSAFAFALYFGLRKTVFYDAHLDYQSSPLYMIQNLFRFQLDKTQYLRQLILAMNIFIIYIGVVIYKSKTGREFSQRKLNQILLLFLEVNIVSISGGHGNNVGRYFYLVIPFLIITLVEEIASMVGVMLPGKSFVSMTQEGAISPVLVTNLKADGEAATASVHKDDTES